ncbi:MAG: hypothetical protein ACJAZ9_000548 [Neolewinella sp.]
MFKCLIRLFFDACCVLHGWDVFFLHLDTSFGDSTNGHSERYSQLFVTNYLKPPLPKSKPVPCATKLLLVRRDEQLKNRT